MDASPPGTLLRVPVKVYFYDTDAGGVVHNVAYLRMIEQARSDLAEAMEWPMSTMLDGSGPCPVVARTEIDYLLPARIGDDLVLEARLDSLGRVRMEFSFEMIRTPGEEIICRCRQTLVPIDLQTGRPCPVPTDWRAKILHATC